MRTTQEAREHLAALVQSGAPIIWVTTHDERRAERQIADVLAKTGFHVRYWDCAVGGVDTEGEPVLSGVDPGAPLEAIADRKQNEGWILRDYDALLDDAEDRRALKTAARQLVESVVMVKRKKPGKGSEKLIDVAVFGRIVILSTSAAVPLDLEGSVVQFAWPLPTRSEAEAIIHETLSGQDTTALDIPALAEAVSGLDASQIEGLIALQHIKGDMSKGATAAAKRDLINNGGLFQWRDPEPAGLDAIGGLEALKRWVLERRSILTDDARKAGIPCPRGLFLAGAPGCGKSLAAKVVSAAWSVPLIQLDLGGLKESYVGASEANIRLALDRISSVAPCVLWIDEVEKALAGATSRGDSGVGADALGVLLAWMSERPADQMVFVIATANDTSQLPSELLREGRFDARFFVDLPNEDERDAVVRVALKKYKVALDDDFGELVKVTDGFTSVGIDSLVPDAMIRAWGDGKRSVTGTDLLEIALGTKPSVKGDPRLEIVRKWAEGNAKHASESVKASVQRTMSSGRQLMPATT